MDPLNQTDAENSYLLSLYNSGLLLNPVVGLSLSPNHSRMTIGALDPNDYDGPINWVPVAKDGSFNLDGFIGLNGSALPFQYPLQALAESSELSPV